MFEKILSKAVTKVLGRYIHLDEIKIPFWKGEFELQNLRIKDTLFAGLEIPVEFRKGVISKLTVTIPWRHLLTQPVSIKIEGVYVHLVRKDQTDTSGEGILNKKLKERNNAKLTLDDIAKAQEHAEEREANQGSSYIQRMIKRVAENIQFTINSVHICFQDWKSTPEHQYSIGLTIDSINVTNTDKDWVPIPNHVISENETHKLISLFNLSVYLDTDKGVTRTMGPDEDIVSVLAHTISRQRFKVDHQYIVEPLSGHIKVTILQDVMQDGHVMGSCNCGQLHGIGDHPVYNVELGLKEIEVRVDDNQYRDLLNLVGFYHDWKTARRYRKFRPSKPVKVDPRAWWRFAGEAIIHEMRKMRGYVSWSDIERRRSDRRAYVKMFKDKLRGQIKMVEADLLDELEKRLSYEDVVFFRAIAERELRDEGDKPTKDNLQAGLESRAQRAKSRQDYEAEKRGDGKRSPKQSPPHSPALSDSEFSDSGSDSEGNYSEPETSYSQKSWSDTLWSYTPWGWNANKDEPTDETRPDVTSLSQNELQSVQETTGYDVSRVAHIYERKDEYPMANIHCRLKAARFTIGDWRDGVVHELGKIVLTEALLVSQITPLRSSFEFALQSIELFDMCSPNTHFQHIVRPRILPDTRTELEKQAEADKKDQAKKDKKAKGMKGKGKGKGKARPPGRESEEEEEEEDDEPDEPEEVDPVLWIDYKKNPTDSNSDAALKVNLLPLDIVYSKPFIDTMLVFFSRADSRALTKLKETVIEKFRKLQQQAMEEVKSLLRNQKYVDFNLDLQLPNLMMPEAYDRMDTAMLCVCPGRFNFESEPRSLPPNRHHVDEEQGVPHDSIFENDNPDGFRSMQRQAVERLRKEDIEKKKKWWNDHLRVQKIARDYRKLKPLVDSERERVKGDMEDKGKHKADHDLEQKKVDGGLKDLESAEGAGINDDDVALYDAYVIGLKGMQILLIQNITKPTEQVSEILSPWAADVFMENCVLPYDLDLPQIKAAGQAHPIIFNLSSAQLYQLCRIAGRNDVLFLGWETQEDEEVLGDASTEEADRSLLVRRQSRADVDLAFMMSDTKDVIKTRKQTKEKLIATTLVDAHLLIPSIQITVGYNDEDEKGLVRLTMERIKCAGLIKAFRMETMFTIGFIEAVEMQTNDILITSRPMKLPVPVPVGTNTGNPNTNPGDPETRPRAADQGDDIGDKEENTFASLNIINVSRRSLEYNYVDYFLDAEVHKLQVTLHRDILVAVMRMISMTSAQYYNAVRKPESQLEMEGKTSRSAEGIVDTSGNELSLLSVAPTEDDILWEVKCKISAKLEKVSLILRTNMSDITQIEARNLCVDGYTQGDTYDIDGSVNSLEVLDLTKEGAKYRPVLHPQISPGARTKANNDDQENALVTFKINSFDRKHDDYPGYDIWVSARIGRIRYVMLMQFINYMRRFSHQLEVKYQRYNKMAKDMMEKSRQEAQTGRSDTINPAPNVENRKARKDQRAQAQVPANDPNFDPYTQVPTLIKLDIEISNPTIVMPRSAVADEMVMVTVNKVVISNTLSTRQFVTNTIHVRLLGAMVHTFVKPQSVDSTGPGRPAAHRELSNLKKLLGEPVDVNLDVLMRYNDVTHVFPDMEMVLTTPKLPLIMSAHQYNLLLLMINHNVNESVIGPPPIPARTDTAHRWTELRFALAIDVVILRLSDAMSEPFLFAQSELTKLGFDVDLYTDTEMEMRMRTHSWNMFDTRGSVPDVIGHEERREIFRVEYEDPLKDQYEILHYWLHANGLQVIHINVDSPRLYGALDVTSRIANFLAPATDPEVTPIRPSVNSVKEDWEPVIDLVLNAYNLDLVLMRDYSLEWDHSGLLINMDMSMSWQTSADNVQKLTLKSKDVRARVKRVAGPPRMIWPVKMDQAIPTHPRPTHSDPGAGPQGRKGIKSSAPVVDAVEQNVGGNVTASGKLGGMEAERGRSNIRKRNMEIDTLLKEEMMQGWAATVEASRLMDDEFSHFMERFNINVVVNMIPFGLNHVFVQFDPIEMRLSSRVYRSVMEIMTTLQAMDIIIPGAAELETVPAPSSAANTNEAGETRKGYQEREEKKNRKSDEEKEFKGQSSSSKRVHEVSQRMDDTKATTDEAAESTEGNGVLRVDELGEVQKFGGDGELDELRPLDAQLRESLRGRVVRFAGDIDKKLRPTYALEDADWDAHKVSTEVIINTSGVRVLFMDDFTRHRMNAPLFILRLEELIAKIKYDPELSVRIDSRLDMDYFNNYNAVWEPAIEPWQMRFLIKQTGRCYDYEIASPDNMNLNVSSAFLQNLNQSLKAWNDMNAMLRVSMTEESMWGYQQMLDPKQQRAVDHGVPYDREGERDSSSEEDEEEEDGKGRTRVVNGEEIIDQETSDPVRRNDGFLQFLDTKKTRRGLQPGTQNYSPFWVTNLTGSKIRYRLETTGGLVKSGSQGLVGGMNPVRLEEMPGQNRMEGYAELTPGKDAPIDIGERELLELNEEALHKMILAVEVAGFDQMIYVPLRQVREYTFSLDMRDQEHIASPQPVVLTARVRIVKGSKMVLLHSPLIFENHTPFPLDVSLDLPASTASLRPERHEEVVPNSNYYIAVVEPGKPCAPVPLRRVHDSKLRIRPSCPGLTNAFHWSTELINYDTFNEDTTFQCVQRMENAEGIVYENMKVSLPKICYFRLNTQRTDGSLIIKICPMVEIDNQIPYPLQYVLVPYSKPTKVKDPRPLIITTQTTSTQQYLTDGSASGISTTSQTSTTTTLPSERQIQHYDEIKNEEVITQLSGETTSKRKKLKNKILGRSKEQQKQRAKELDKDATMERTAAALMGETPNELYYQGMVESSERHCVFDAHIKDQFMLELKINDFTLSTPVKISEMDLDSGVPKLVKLKDAQGQPLWLHVEYVTRDGIQKLRVYNQYQLVNKTGLNIFYKRKGADEDRGVAGQDHFLEDRLFTVAPEDWFEAQQHNTPPLMFSYSKPDARGNKLCVRVGQSPWSDPLPITSIGERGQFKIKDSAQYSVSSSGETTLTARPRVWCLGLSVDIAENNRTKVLTFSPRFVFVNNHGRTILVNQLGTDEIIRLEDGQKFPLSYLYDVPNTPKLMQVKYEDANSWSAPIDIRHLGDNTLKIFAHHIITPTVEESSEASPAPSTSTGRSVVQYDSDITLYYLNVHVRLNEATLFVMFTNDHKPTYRIDNHTPLTLRIQQRGQETAERIGAEICVPFAWDLPLEEHILEVGVEGSQYRGVFKMDKIKDYPICRVERADPNAAGRKAPPVVITTRVTADGAIRILEFNLATSEEAMEAIEQEQITTQFNLNLGGIGISLINGVPQELLFVSLEGMEIYYGLSDLFEKLEVKLHHLQVDNQMANVSSLSHPVILAPVKEDNTKPFIHFAYLKSNKVSNIDYYHNLFFLIQEMDVRIEERFLYVMYEFYNGLDTSFLEQLTNVAIPPTATTTGGGAAATPAQAEYNDTLVGKEDSSHAKDDVKRRKASIVEINDSPLAESSKARNENGWYDSGGNFISYQESPQPVSAGTSSSFTDHFEEPGSMVHQTPKPNLNNEKDRDSNGEIITVAAEVGDNLPPQLPAGRNTSVDFPASREEPALSAETAVPPTVTFISDAIEKDHAQSLPSVSTTPKIAPPKQEVKDADLATIEKKDAGRKMYLNLFVINSVKINLTFNLSKHGTGLSGAKVMGKNKGKTEETPVVRFFRGIGFVLGNIQNAPIHLHALTLRHVFGTSAEIAQPLQKHYTQEGLREAFKVLGSFEFLGNPVGLFRSIGTGVIDFFVEPAKGIVQSPKDFKTGLAKGSQSLAKNTIYGLANTFSQLSQNTARGLATLSMDEDYLLERQHIVREHPRNVLEGAVQGGRAIKAGVKHGVTGVVMLPVEGAQKEGAIGFVKGVGKGITGVVVKPVAGVFDAATTTTEGVRNATKAAGVTERRRTPRYFPPDGTLSTYSPSKSYGQYLLYTTAERDMVKSSAHPKDDEPKMVGGVTGEFYQAHVIYNNSVTVMFTNLRIICFRDPRGFIQKWEAPYDNIMRVMEVDEGIRIMLKKPMPKRRKSFFGWRKVSFYLVKCREPAARRFLYERALSMLEHHAKTI
eukprot:TRINITY_DN217_c0_g3_i2.p1 TRINITY_DN217_c0_g3~~TRINITY_DN217_c0_g3_i2.p1  ORF type:complete len:4071 (-),score=1079.60 TRINITY_DN217_c0_g3_i2:73-12285(-)